MNQTFTAPQDFTAKFPQYVYRSGKGVESVQWRQAALDMANDRAKLIEFTRLVLNGMVDRVTLCREASALLKEVK